MAAAKAAAILVRWEGRRVEGLYNASEILYGPEVPSKTIERLIWRYMNQKVHAKAESRTCNVCSAPCSSCMHFSTAQMGLKSDDFSNETDPVAVASQQSINEAKTGGSLQHTEHEACNLLFVNSNHDSYSENIESKATMLPSAVSVEFKDHGIQRTFSNKYDSSKSVEGHDGNISCASRASDASNKDLDIKNSSHNSLSVCSLGSEKVLSSQKLDLSELLKEEEVGCTALRMQSPYSPSGKVAVGGSSEIFSKIPKSKANIDNNSDVPLNNGDTSLNEAKQDVSTELVELPDKPESPLQVPSADEGYESDATEDDVEVCDICGDAGQEDLLAKCSKCSDGAEHTYCMREMLQKVPEGYWLCEECKLVEEIESQQQGLDVEGEKENQLSSSIQSLPSRHGENLEGALSLKRKAVETSIQSLDEGKVKPYLQNSFGNHSGDDMTKNVRSPTSGTQLQGPKGTLFKSNSFNTSSSKPKVKLVDEVVLKKQKSAREHATFDSREELCRSSNKLHVQDLKGLKKVRERLSLERKSFPKLDRSCSTVSIHKADQKLTPRADTISHSSASDNRETKVVQSDGKLSTLSRSTRTLAHKGVETADISVPSTNGLLSSEQKLNELSQTEEPSSSSPRTAKKSNNLNGLVSDGHSRSFDSTNQSEKSKESSVSRSSRSTPCLKCKEMSHTVDCCPVSQAFGADLSAPRTSREEIYKGNELKAAIEAAIRLRPGIRERASNKAKNMISVEGIHEGQENLRNQASISNIKLLNSHSIDTVSAVSSVHNPSMREISIPRLALGSDRSKISAIPELEYIWQGDFEVHKSGKPRGFSAEIQAHLSTLASPKVLEVVNTFPHKVSLNEVPRLSTWPPHFHDSGPKEDNIALYFFAKDLRSYESYKALVDTMVKNDFALKGSFDGVELLIFPSNQLPEKCQRWNALLFLWGVFQGRRANSSNSMKCVRIPDASMPRLDRGIAIDITRPVDNRSAACDSTCNVVPVTSAVGKACMPTDRVGDNNASSCAKLEEKDSKVGSKLLPRIATSNTQVHPEIKCSSPPPEGSKVPDGRSDTELKPCLQAAEIISGSVIVEKEEMHVRGDDAIVVGKIHGDSVKITDLMDDAYADEKTSSKRDLDCCQPNYQKRKCLDLSETVSEICTDTSQKMPWSEVKRVYIAGGIDNKRLKTGFSGGNQCNNVGDQGPSDYSLGSDTHNLCSASPVEERRGEIACENKVNPKDMSSGEGCFFPVVSHQARELQLGDNSKPWKELFVKDENRVHDASPNLELALGAEMRPQSKEISPSPVFVETVDKNHHHKKVTGKKEDDASASLSLSLSLSFPFPEKERNQNAKPVSNTEQVTPEGNAVNTSPDVWRAIP